VKREHHRLNRCLDLGTQVAPTGELRHIGLIRDVREAAYEVLAKIQAKRIKKNLNDDQVRLTLQLLVRIIADLIYASN
jgi:hypothetical protein